MTFPYNMSVAKVSISLIPYIREQLLIGKNKIKCNEKGGKLEKLNILL